MSLAGENRRARRKTCPRDTLSITTLIRTGLGLNSGLCDEKVPTNSLTYWKRFGEFRQLCVMYHEIRTIKTHDKIICKNLHNNPQRKNNPKRNFEIRK